MIPPVRPRLTEDGTRWLDAAEAKVKADPGAVLALFPAAGRACGRGPLPETGWTVDLAVRATLLTALPLDGEALGELLFDLYTHGDTAERLGVLAGLDALDGRLGDAGLPIVRDALRTSDTRLIGAALGSYGAARLPAEAYRQAVLKCVFTGVPLDTVRGLDTRADRELARMMADFARERAAAGREVPADIWPVVERHPEVLAELTTELPSLSSGAL
ncbi:EboA domain-containing protein [Acrocarpospora catenulata]|uniref:EboA domain-containing protein n=1 Tax=Acrocarpospora catenulata TaxID=2836182 RepID=UPI001BDAE959|nr:EboA domain-containing protein [Acrocarpospora catenulata]